MINKFIRNFIAKQMAGRSDDGIMITLRDPQKVELAENIMADLLMRNGIDPRAITSEAQLKTIINQIEAMTKQSTTTSGIRNTTSAKVFDLKGRKIKNTDNIMGGEEMPPPGSRGGADDIAAPVQSSEETLKNMIQAENKKNIAAMKQRKMLDDAIEDASPGFANDIKYDAEIVAENLAERMGLVYDDLPTKQRLDLYDKAYTGLSKKRFKQRESLEDFVDDAGGVDENDSRGIDDFIPDDDPEPLAKGGIARIGLASGTIPGGYSKNAYKYIREIDMDIAKAFKKYKASGGKLDFDTYSSEAKRAMFEKDTPAMKAKGGIARIGLKDGMNRRTFLKLLGGAMSIPIIGKILKPFKIGKKVTQVPIIKTDNVPGKPEWFDQLVNKVILEGDDVTKRFATGERQSIHQKTLKDGSVVRVTEDVDDGAVRVEYESETNVFGDPVQMQYKKPLPDEGDPRPTAEFDVAESGPVGRQTGPDDFEIDVDEVGGTSIRDLNSDVSILKEYATGQKPTMKELVQNIKRKDKAARITDDIDGAASDAVVRRQGDYDPSDYDDFARGGIARMLGE